MIKLTFGSPLLAVALHRYVSIQMIKRAIRLFATVPPTLVHAFNFFISSPRSLVLLGSRNRDKGVDLLRTILSMKSATSHKSIREHN